MIADSDTLSSLKTRSPVPQIVEMKICNTSFLKCFKRHSNDDKVLFGLHVHQVFARRHLIRSIRDQCSSVPSIPLIQTLAANRLRPSVSLIQPEKVFVTLGGLTFVTGKT